MALVDAALVFTLLPDTKVMEREIGMYKGIPVIDAVAHAYNWLPENHANKHAQMLADDVFGFAHMTSKPGFRLSREGFLRDWTPEDVANVSFFESYADLVVSHVLPVRAFKDGFVGVEKNVEFTRRWPKRFVTYVGVDPMDGPRALEDLEEQVQAMPEAIGLKLYPNSWMGDEVNGWFMDDPEIAFPLFEHALKLGLKVVAIHKAVPLGPVPREHYGVTDIDRAAGAFPDLQFEIVHGGMAFLEETAWQLARFPNVWVNLEITSAMAVTRPAAFHEAMATLLLSPDAVNRIFWGSGSTGYHPRPLIEAFVDKFEFTPEFAEGRGLPLMDETNKRKILAENYARLAGIDLSQRLVEVKGDELDRGDRPPAAPYSTTPAAAFVE